jgi:hypothetical protein
VTRLTEADLDEMIDNPPATFRFLCVIADGANPFVWIDPNFAMAGRIAVVEALRAAAQQVEDA